MRDGATDVVRRAGDAELALAVRAPAHLHEVAGLDGARGGAARRV